MENLRADAKKRLEYASEQLYSGKMTLNEAREYIGLSLVNKPAYDELIISEKFCNSKRKNWGLNFLHMFCRDGTYKKVVEIVDYDNKESLGMFKITNITQYLVDSPPDMPQVKGIYKECFNILENSK